MALLLFVIFLLALVQNAATLKPYGSVAPYPFTYGNSTSIANPTATGHHGPLISTTGVPHHLNGTMIDDTYSQASYSPDCICAAKWSPYTFIECLSELDNNKIKYTISLTDVSANPAFNYIIDGWSRRIMQLHGFTLAFSFDEWDANDCHDVVKNAIIKATCPGVNVVNDLACIKKGDYSGNFLPAGS
ncbi:hypothetical protein PG993_012236 [Apiospora rasikravindrae]|uniref:Uncharacterized protein n=1 Tax=Apiospora rasikravindrae TaxID=990691 RepID=A0ABR1S3B0_9PEZI